MASEVVVQVKVEIEHLFKAKFIWMAIYITWISNIVLVIKKKKLHVYNDFSNLSNTTLKDGYLMPVVNMLVDLSIENAILSFMDGHSGFVVISSAS